MRAHKKNIKQFIQYKSVSDTLNSFLCTSQYKVSEHSCDNLWCVVSPPRSSSPTPPSAGLWYCRSSKLHRQLRPHHRHLWDALLSPSPIRSPLLLR